MSCERIRQLCLLPVVFCLVFATESRAQVLYGSLTGNVTDATGAAVPNVKVEASNIGTGISRVATTDSSGSYSFNDLQAGAYRITFTAPSFRTVVQEGVRIVSNSILRSDLQLQVAQVSDTI